MQAHLLQIQDSMQSTMAKDDNVAKIISLSNRNGMTITFMDIGATWLSCNLPIKGKQREVLLRSKNMKEHMKQKAYFGSIVGRYANRIDQGQFNIDDITYQVGTNDANNSLHGGFDGLDKRRWLIELQTSNNVVFALQSLDGDQGYPGNLNIKVCYTLSEDNAVQIDYYAETDKSCPLNLTNHAYFNLAGESSQAKSVDHRLQMSAPHYLPTREDLIPTGELRSVTGTTFDFTKEKLIGVDLLADEDQRIAGGYDHAFIFTHGINDGKMVVATLTSPEKDVQMKIKTTKPAIQFYSGNFLAGTPGLSKEYQIYDGLALETQFFPDGPNHPEWAENSGILKAGESYQHQTTYQFEF